MLLKRVKMNELSLQMARESYITIKSMNKNFHILDNFSLINRTLKKSKFEAFIDLY